MHLKEFATNVKRKTCSKVVNIVPVFWKSSDELSQRLSVPVCQEDPEKEKDGKESLKQSLLWNDFSYEYKVQEGCSKEFSTDKET